MLEAHQGRGSVDAQAVQASCALLRSLSEGGAGEPATNQPPATPRTDGAGSAALGGANPGTRRKDGTTNYELDHSIRHVQHAPGGVKRLSVAVLVNHRGTLNAQGKPETQALSNADLEKITNLVKETMGFSNERGDSVNVVNSRFATDPVLAVAELPWWRQPENLALAGTAGKSLMFGLLALSLLFWVVRPLMRKAQPMQSLAQAPLVSGALDADGEATSVNVSAQGEMSQIKRHHENVKYAQDAAVKGPQMVAMLVKHWMSQKNA
jgi:flagellar M-ring protein FliF